MQVAVFGDGMPQRIVDRSVRDFAAVNVSHGNAKRDGSQRGGVHLKSIAQHEQQVRYDARVDLSQPDRAQPHRDGNRFGSVCGEQHVHTVANLEALPSDLIHRPAEQRRQVTARHDQVQFQFGVRLDRAENGHVDPEVRATDGHDSNGSQVGESRLRNVIQREQRSRRDRTAQTAFQQVRPH